MIPTQRKFGVVKFSKTFPVASKLMSNYFSKHLFVNTLLLHNCLFLSYVFTVVLNKVPFHCVITGEVLMIFETGSNSQGLRIILEFPISA